MISCMKRVSMMATLVSAGLMVSSLWAAVPDCTGVEAWPASSAYGKLKNAGLLTPEETMHSATVVERLASENKQNEWFHQVHKIEFSKKDGTSVTVITVHVASEDECSESQADVYLIQEKL